MQLFPASTLRERARDHGEEGPRTWHAHRARHGLNGLRIDTANYVSPMHLEWLGNAIRECGQNTIGLQHLFHSTRSIQMKRPLLIRAQQPSRRQLLDRLCPRLSHCLPAPFDHKGLGARGGPPSTVCKSNCQKMRTTERAMARLAGSLVGLLDNHDQHERFTMPTTIHISSAWSRSRDR